MAAWTREELQRLKELYPVMGMKCAPLFGRSEKAVSVQASKHGINKIKHTKESIQDSLPEGYKVMSYINTTASMSVLHKDCGRTFTVASPTRHLYKNQKFTGCPSCKSIIPDDIELTGNKVYLLYFPDLNLYKLGISVNPEQTSKQYGHDAIIIWVETYENYATAKAREDYLLSKVTKVNTGLLKTGNTETFVDYNEDILNVTI